MKNYYVQLPIAGVVGISVEASNEQDAINQALSTEWSMKELAECSGSFDLEELDLYEHALQGNVCYLPMWEATAEEE